MNDEQRDEFFEHARIYQDALIKFRDRDSDEEYREPLINWMPLR